MSLDVTLRAVAERWVSCPHCSEAFKIEERAGEIYSANITHNLVMMADAAGIYEALWRPDEHSYTKAGQLIPLLKAGLEKMKADPAKFEAFNSPNGWGMYHNFVPWVERYLAACEENPESLVTVNR